MLSSEMDFIYRYYNLIFSLNLYLQAVISSVLVPLLPESSAQNEYFPHKLIIDPGLRQH